MPNWVVFLIRLFDLTTVKVGVVRNQHPYVIDYISAKSGKMCSSKSQKKKKVLVITGKEEKKKEKKMIFSHVHTLCGTHFLSLLQHI
jgi:hypothetical protein